MESFTTFQNSSDTDVRIKNVNLYTERDACSRVVKYYLDVTYQTENLECVCDIHIPKIELPISNDIMISRERVPFDEYNPNPTLYVVKDTVDLGFGPLPLKYIKGEHSEPVLYTVKVIKEKTKKMTVAEIEKALGHKVEIVSEGGK
jgi:hypothetical protein